ncbi:cyclic nucleotide-binding domain-containing protein [Bacteriovoracaceae bacterium]|nr:cyclic nucleotide-binding domain-containing protein [Bacteriovoracaceae bacterium]
MNDLSDNLPDNFAEPISFKKRKVIFAEGEKSAYLYIVVKGEVMIFKDENNRILPITVVGEKDFIGELSMFSDEKRSASAIASEDSQLMMIKKNDIRLVLKECPEWVTSIMNTISDRLRSTVDLLREHRITDDLNTNTKNLTAEETNQFLSSLKDYKSRRGIK